MKFKFKFDLQIFIALGVMLVSFSTMFVTMYQASIMNSQTSLMLKQTKASAWPCLIIGKTELGDKKLKRIATYKFILQNKGTGPAIIKGVRLTYKNKIVKNWYHLHNVMNTPDSIKRSRILSPISKTILSENESKDFIDYSGNYYMIDWMIKMGKDILIEIYYESVFGDMWKIEKYFDNSPSSYPTIVKKCNIKDSEQFER